MAERNNWSQEETMMAFALYFIISPGQQSKSNKKIIELANAIGRTPSAVVRKLGNIGSNDSMRKALGKKGLEHASKLDSWVWEQKAERGDTFMAESMALLQSRTTIAKEFYKEDDDELILLAPEGTTREMLVSVRVNQNYFRNSLLQNYDNACCLTGIRESKLLVASHIKPWKDADPKTERCDAANGLLLNALHDRAFDKGLITIDKDLRIVVSDFVPHNKENDEWLWSYKGCKIRRPKDKPPAPDYIEWHNEMVFKHDHKAIA